LIDAIFAIYDIIENFKASGINKFISLEQIKTFKIYFLEFEKNFSISLEDYKNVFYNKLGYIFCDFQGNICKKNLFILSNFIKFF